MTNNQPMRFSVGYPCSSKVSFFDSISPYLDRIGEVYFGQSSFPSGRAAFDSKSGTDRELMESDLTRFAQKGVRLNLLLNGNCYGARAISKSLSSEVCEIVRRNAAQFNICSVTTASPFIAHTVKTNFPDIDVRASVNTWIDGVAGMQQCADIFDSFYIKRDYNYCIDEIKNEYSWCKAHKKKLYLLANSGCIPNCAYHTFHDNMIAHSKELEADSDFSAFEPYVCRKLMADPENRHLLLSGNLVRPEDVSSYGELVDGIKLATRIHPFPAIIIRAYVKGSWDGCVTALTEPGFADLIEPHILKNSMIPDNYWHKKTSCLRAQNHGSSAYCRDCGYCSELCRSISEKRSDFMFI